MTTTKFIAGGAAFGIVVAVITVFVGPVGAQGPEGRERRGAKAMATEDKLDILQVIAEYSYTFDSRDSEGWAKLFTEEAVWEYIGPQDSKPETSLNGRGEILAWAKMRHGQSPENYVSYHHQSGTFFESLTADTARTRSMVIITVHNKTEATPTVSIFMTGIYYDEWRKTSDGWRFARRTLRG